MDHDFWGRPEEEKNVRFGYEYNRTMGANDLYGGVAGALASSYLVFKKSEPTFADELLKVAVELFAWGLEKDGKYSAYYKRQTASIYSSTDLEDSMAWAGGWLYRATDNTTYLDLALKYWKKGTPDYYPCWDSVWAHHALHMVTLDAQGIIVPGIEIYKAYMARFQRAWLVADGFEDIVKTPLGMVYPSWNEWANLAFSTTAAAMSLIDAKYNKDAVMRQREIDFAVQQVDYAIGSGIRSYVVGWGNNPPQFAHHAAASCPDVPAPCDWNAFKSTRPNPQILYGALVAGPAGVRKSKTDPDATYHDIRKDYVTNEVANDYNAGFATALAGLVQTL